MAIGSLDYLTITFEAIMANYINPDIIKKPTKNLVLDDFELSEFTKCKIDCKYFIEEYVKVRHPVKGLVPFKLYPYQYEILDAILYNKDSIIMASRQMGKTEVTCAYLLWYAMFHNNVQVLVVSNKLTSATEIMDRIKFSYKELPDYIRDSVLEFNKTSVSFQNGSKIVSRATSADAARGLSVSKLYVDEMSFVPPNIQKAFWGAVSPTLSTGGSSIITSTPNNDEDEFAQIWNGAIDDITPTGEKGKVGRNGYKSVLVTWEAHPERDQIWADAELSKIGEERFRREHLCEFISFDATLVNPLAIAGLKAKEPISRMGEVRWFKEPDPECSYFVALDPSLGTSNDSSAIQIIEMPTLIHAGEWLSNKTPPKGQVQVLFEILKYIESCMYEDDDDSIFWSYENNTIGETISEILDNTGIDNFPGNLVSDKKPTVKGKIKRHRKGLNTTNNKKLLACAKLKSLVDSAKLKPVSHGLIFELKNYVASGASYAAKPGTHDDLVSALLLTIRTMELARDWDVFDPELLKEQIDTKEYREPLPFLVSFG